MNLKKLDIYIIRKFLGTFFYAISLLIIIIIIFDISEKMDDFLRTNPSLYKIIFNYYLNFIPYFVNMFSPLFTFIAVIYFTSRLAANTEIVAILNSGISFRRLLSPYLISAIFIALCSFALSNFLIPYTNKNMIEFEMMYIKNKHYSQETNMHMQINPGIFAYAEHYNSDANIAYHFCIEKINEKGLYYKLTSDNAQYDTTEGTWHIQNYYIRTIDGTKETIKNGASIDTTLNLKPSDFIENLHDIETMNLMELNSFIADEALKGSDRINYYLVEKHKRLAFPFATVVLTLIGVSLSSQKRRGGTGINLGLGLILSFAFILFMQISTTFATNGNLPPQIAVWIPNIIFGALGIYLLRMAPK